MSVYIPEFLRFTSRRYPVLFYGGLLAIVLAALFTSGAHHPDEHFQILEFAISKLDGANVVDMPWEHGEKIRSTIQPTIAFGWIKLMRSMHISDPFHQAALLRLMTGLMAWLIALRWTYWAIRESRLLRTAEGMRFMMIAMMGAWFIPYLNVRFSSENISGLLLIVSLLFMFRPREEESSKSIHLLLSGISLGLAFCFRFQIAFAGIGLIAWLVWYRNVTLTTLLYFFAGGVFAVALGSLVDYWFYGEWVFTPWEYFDANIIQGKAREFGTDPWWYYFTNFLTAAVPPVSVLLAILFISGLYKARTSVSVWILLVFLLGHILVSHKEFRFLFPVVIIFLTICAVGFDQWRVKPARRKAVRVVLYTVLAINMILFAGRVFIPANDMMPLHRMVYRASTDEKVILGALETDPFDKIQMTKCCRNSFYRSDNIEAVKLQSHSDLIDLKLQSDKPVYLIGDRYNMTLQSEQFELKCVYTPIPEFLLKININNWQDRTRLLYIYEVVASM